MSLGKKSSLAAGTGYAKVKVPRKYSLLNENSIFLSSLSLMRVPLTSEI